MFDIPDFDKIRGAIMAFPEPSAIIFMTGVTLGWGASYLIAKRELKVNRSIIEALKDERLSDVAKRKILQNSLPQQGRWRLMARLLAGLAVFLTIVVFGFWYFSSYILGEMAGGKNYCFYRADVRDRDPQTQKIPLWLECTGPIYNLSTWIVPGAIADPRNPLYWKGTGQQWRETYATGIISGIEVPLGKYRIEMSARNGNIIEILEIKETDGKLAQSLEVSRSNTILRSEKDAAQ